MNVNKININQSESSYYIASDIYDVSAHNNDAVFESLSALLGSDNLSTLIPTAVRCGGMTIRFVQSSDNKYVQFRLMSNMWSTTIADWQGVDDEPTAGSDNLVKSGSVADKISELDERTSNKEESNNKLDSNSFVGKEFKEFNDVPLYLANGKTFADIMSETQKFCVKVVTEEGKISDYAGYFNLLDANGEVVGNNYSYFNIGVTNGGITDPSVLRGIKFHWYVAEHHNIAKYITIVKNTDISPDLYEESLIPIESRHLLERVERLQETKVDKQEGKNLSSNDFTNNDKKNIADLQKELFVEKVVSNNFLDTRNAIGKTFAEINEKPFYIGEGLTMKDLFDKFGSLKLVIDGGVKEYSAYLQAVDKDGNNVGNTTTIRNDLWFGYGHFADYSDSIFGFKLHTYIASQGLVVNTFGIMTDRSRDNDTYQSELKSRIIPIDDSIKDIKTEIPTINARLDNLEEKKTNKIVCVGDSLTTNYPKQLEYPYDRIFCGGEDSIANLSRIGGIAINNKTDIVIPSSGSTLPFEICSAWRRNNGDNRELNFSIITPSNPYYRIGTVKMAGVEGTIDKASVDVYGLLVYDSTNSIVARQKSNANFTLPSNAAYIKVCINSPYSGEPHLTITGDDKHIVSLCSNEGYLKEDGSVNSGPYKYSDAIPVIGGQSVYADNLATGNMYVFTRNADGEEVVCGAYSDIYSHIIKDMKNESFIIMTGQNGGWEDADDLVNQIASSVVNIEKYLVVCTYTERTTVDVLKKMREKFGEKFFDLKTFMEQQSVYEAKRLGLIIEGEQKDWRNIFIQDAVHPNIIGDELWAKVFTNKLIELGYL